MRVHGYTRLLQRCRRGDDQIGSGSERRVIGGHHLRVHKTREGRVLIDTMIDEQSGIKGVHQIAGGGQVCPEQMLPETQAPQRPADVSGQHSLVHPVDLPPHVSEGQEGRRSQGPETGLLFLQPRGHAAPALPALRHPEGRQSSHRLLHIEHPVGSSQAVHDLLLAGPVGLPVQRRDAYYVLSPKHGPHLPLSATSAFPAKHRLYRRTWARAAARVENSARALRAAASPKRRRFFSSLSSSSTNPASCSAIWRRSVLLGTRYPVTPCSKASDTPPTSVATTGRPTDIASRTDKGNPSDSEVKRYTSSPRRNGITGRTSPCKTAIPPKPAASTVRSRRSRSCLLYT